MKTDLFSFRSTWATFWKVSLCFFTLTLMACTSGPKKPELPEVPSEPLKSTTIFEKRDFSSVPTVKNTDWQQTLSAFQISCRSMGKKTVWQSVCNKASETLPGDAEDFFRTEFTPWQMFHAKIGATSGIEYERLASGLMTGYYEPMLQAQPHKDSKHLIPILGTPDDLIIVDLGKLYPELKGKRFRGKVVGRRLVPYEDRATIVKKSSLDKYAIAWSNDPVAVFFLQIQGSGRLKMPDGSFIRVGYDDQNGHPYKAVGSWLVQRGYLQRHELSMQRIQQWAQQNPKRVNELLNQNPSFVFFKTREAASPNEGPIGAQGLPLTPLASVAVDRSQLPLGVPLIVDVQQQNPDLAFTRAVVAQDTGGAIRGPLRFDYFWGYGDQAALQAGKQKSQVGAWLLLPNGITPEALKKR